MLPIENGDQIEELTKWVENVLSFMMNIVNFLNEINFMIILSIGLTEIKQSTRFILIIFPYANNILINCRLFSAHTPRLPHCMH